MATLRNWSTGAVLRDRDPNNLPPGFVVWDEAQSARDDQMRAASAQEAGKPQYPTLDSWIKGDANSPTLADSLLYNPNKSAGYSGIRDIATAAPGTSAWEKMMLQRQGLEESQGRDSLNRDSAAARAMGFSDIAKRGGLSRGAMTSIGRSSARDLLSGRQNLSMGGAQNRLGIGVQGEQNRVGALGQLSGMDESAGKYNITNLLTQKRMEDAAKLGKYSEEMKAWAANKQADATANSGKK